MADRNCAGCADKIGYDQRFFCEDDGSLLHLKCWQPDNPPSPQFDPSSNPALDNRKLPRNQRSGRSIHW